MSAATCSEGSLPTFSLSPTTRPSSSWLGDVCDPVRQVGKGAANAALPSRSSDKRHSVEIHGASVEARDNAQRGSHDTQVEANAGPSKQTSRLSPVWEASFFQSVNAATEERFQG